MPPRLRILPLELVRHANELGCRQIRHAHVTHYRAAPRGLAAKDVAACCIRLVLAVDAMVQVDKSSFPSPSPGGGTVKG